MRYFFIFAFLVLPFSGFSQNLFFKICGSTAKKWVGQDIMTDKPMPNPITYTFFRKHTVNIYDAVKKETVTKRWFIIQGQFQDDDVILQIDKKQYHVTFSKTSNGKEFMLLSTGGGEDEPPLVTRSYYAE